MALPGFERESPTQQIEVLSTEQRYQFANSDFEVLFI